MLVDAQSHHIIASTDDTATGGFAMKKPEGWVVTTWMTLHSSRRIFSRPSAPVTGWQALADIANYIEEHEEGASWLRQLSLSAT